MNFCRRIWIQEIIELFVVEFDKRAVQRKLERIGLLQKMIALSYNDYPLTSHQNLEISSMPLKSEVRRNLKGGRGHEKFKIRCYI